MFYSSDSTAATTVNDYYVSIRSTDRTEYKQVVVKRVRHSYQVLLPKPSQVFSEIRDRWSLVLFVSKYWARAPPYTGGVLSRLRFLRLAIIAKV